MKKQPSPFELMELETTRLSWNGLPLSARVEVLDLRVKRGLFLLGSKLAMNFGNIAQLVLICKIWQLVCTGSVLLGGLMKNLTCQIAAL